MIFVFPESHISVVYCKVQNDLMPKEFVTGRNNKLAAFCTMLNVYYLSTPTKSASKWRSIQLVCKTLKLIQSSNKCWSCKHSISFSKALSQTKTISAHARKVVIWWEVKTHEEKPFKERANRAWETSQAVIAFQELTKFNVFFSKQYHISCFRSQINRLVCRQFV